jgi:hypothetical protein
LLELILIDVALCALLVVVAGCIMLVRRRRRRHQDPMRAAERQGTGLELAGDGMAGHETAVVPGFGDGWAEPDPGANVPAEAKHAADPQASGTTGPAPDPDGPAAERDKPRTKADERGTEPGAPRAERHAPRAAPNGQPAAAHAAVSDRIGSYYDEADRAMSDYLAAMGWGEEPETRRTG